MPRSQYKQPRTRHSTSSLERGGQMGLLTFPGSYFDDHILWIVYKQ